MVESAIQDYSKYLKTDTKAEVRENFVIDSSSYQ